MAKHFISTFHGFQVGLRKARKVLTNFAKSFKEINLDVVWIYSDKNNFGWLGLRWLCGLGVAYTCIPGFFST